MNPTKRKHFDSDEEYKTFNFNYAIFREEQRQFREELWERSTFCECGADDILECSCSLEKRKRYMRRQKRKMKEKFGERMMKAFRGQIPVKGDPDWAFDRFKKSGDNRESSSEDDN